MDEEAADELVRCERHPLVTSTTVGAIVFVFEGDAVAVERDQPAVGDGDTVGIAREIGKHRVGSAERSLAVDSPLAPARWRQVGGEGLALGECGVNAEELQFAGCGGSKQLLPR